MSYQREWMADQSGESGTATFIIDGEKYTIRLDNFLAFQAIGKMLDAVFKQGKTFSYQALRDHVERSLDAAQRVHDLA